MKILITGVAGFIAFNFAKELSKLKNVKVKPDYEGNAFDVTITYNIVGIDALPQQLNFALQSTR